MSYLALYRKYRPSKFEEVVGQDVTIKILKNSIVNNKISHAYLFSGPRGTGKTTIAKLIAKLINCFDRDGDLPCEKCDSCVAFNNKNNPDIIEMDAASNNGVDEIREIRDKIGLMPSICKYKVYIIDEVHMLSTGAFNALLKTLEEPPEHVVFILATTEFNKVPETIVSRCQCFNFERISEDDIIKELSYIASCEKMKIDKKVFPLIAKYSDGGLRDAINMLDKLYCASDKITVDDFYDLRGLVGKEDFDFIVDNLFKGNVKDVLDRVDLVCSKGKNVVLFVSELLDYIKNLIVDCSTGKNNDYDFDILCKIIDMLDDVILKMKSSSNPKLLLEVVLLKICNLFNNNLGVKEESAVKESKKEVIDESKSNDNLIVETKEKIVPKIEEKECISKPKKVNKAKVSEIDNELVAKNKKMLLENRNIRVNNAFATANKEILSNLRKKWNLFSNYLNNSDYSCVVSYLLDGVLRVAGDEYLIISVKYDSILENAFKCLDKVEELCDLVMNKKYKITFVSDENWDKLKLKYISDHKNGIKYNLMEENKIDYDIINGTDEEEVSEVVEDAISLFGEDLVEVKN